MVISGGRRNRDKVRTGWEGKESERWEWSWGCGEHPGT